jgi:hypothetical protein
MNIALKARAEAAGGTVTGISAASGDRNSCC